MKTKLLDDNARRSIAQSKRRPAKVTLAPVGRLKKGALGCPYTTGDYCPVLDPAFVKFLRLASLRLTLAGGEACFAPRSPTPTRLGEAGRGSHPSAAK